MGTGGHSITRTFHIRPLLMTTTGIEKKYIQLYYLRSIHLSRRNRLLNHFFVLSRWLLLLLLRWYSLVIYCIELIHYTLRGVSIIAALIAVSGTQHHIHPGGKHHNRNLPHTHSASSGEYLCVSLASLRTLELVVNNLTETGCILLLQATIHT